MLLFVVGLRGHKSAEYKMRPGYSSAVEHPYAVFRASQRAFNLKHAGVD